MHNNPKQHGKRYLAAMAFVMLCSLAVFGISGAMIYKFNESDPLRTDIATPACNFSDNQSASDIGVADNRLFAIVWEDNGCDGVGNGSGIYVERYDIFTGATPTTGPERVNTTLTGDQKNPAIAMDNEGNYVIAWEGEGSGDTYGIFVRAFDADGTPRGPEHLVNTYTTGIQSSPKIAMDFDRFPVSGNEQQFAVVWQGEGTGDADGIYMQMYKIQFGGDIVTWGSQFLVNTYTTGAQVDPDVAMNNFDEPLVTWSGPGTGYPATSEIWMQGYREDATPINGTATNFRANTTSPAIKPAIAANKSFESTAATVPGGHFVIVYEGASDGQIYGKLVDRCLNIPAECGLGNVELNIAAGDLPDVAMDYMGNFTVTWEQDDTAEGQYINIHGINYDYLGRRIDDGFRINENIYSDGAQNQTNSAVAKDKDGEYFTTWTTPSFTGDLDVRHRGYGTDIFKNGTETLAHTGTAGFDEYGVSTAIAPNGYHAVAFLGQDTTSLQTRVYYSLYDGDGNVIVENQVADTVDDSSVGPPSVSFFKDTAGSGLGRFVIAWAGTNPATSFQAIVYREFDVTGAPVSATELEASDGAESTTYGNPLVSAGYYNDSGSNVIDRFALIYPERNILVSQTGIMSSYHTASGFTFNMVEPISASCEAICGFTNVDLYADINGNDKIVYVWDADDTSQAGIFFQEANGSVLGATLSGSPARTNNTTANPQFSGDVAFVSPTQYVISWNSCPGGDCTGVEVFASRYTGNFAGGAATISDDDFIVYPGGGIDVSTNRYAKIAGDPVSGSFLVVWNKTYDDVGYAEIYGKYYETAAGLVNLGVGFVINASRDASPFLPAVDMNNAGKVIVGWDGTYRPFGISIDSTGAVFQLLYNPSVVQSTPELPTAAELSIVEGGKTLTIPSVIQFPSVTATTMVNTDVEREIDENPAAGEPLYFQVEDLGGNSTGCVPGPCYSVTISSTAFTYTDPVSGQTYTIPASNISIKNYDGNHPGVTNTGLCGSPEANLSFEALFGVAADFALDPTTCDYVPINTNRTLINKITNTSDTARIRMYPKLKITVPALTPPGTYTGTITITSA